MDLSLTTKHARASNDDSNESQKDHKRAKPNIIEGSTEHFNIDDDGNARPDTTFDNIWEAAVKHDERKWRKY